MKDFNKAQELFDKYEEDFKPLEVTVPVTFTISNADRKSARVEIKSAQEVHDNILELPEVKQRIDNIEKLYKSLSEEDAEFLQHHMWNNKRNWFPSSGGIENDYIPDFYYKI